MEITKRVMEISFPKELEEELRIKQKEFMAQLPKTEYRNYSRCRCAKCMTQY
jgi:hypothetical protein